MKRRLSLNEDTGSAIVQVLFLSVFVMIVTYALSDFLSRNDDHSRRIIDRTVYMSTGSDTAEILSDPNSTMESQGVTNTKAYP